MEEVSFGEWLRRRRKALDLTQEQLAQQISCSTSALRKIEAEERRPSEQIVEQLANVFNIPSEERATFLKFARGNLEAVPAGEIEDAPWRSSPISKPEALSKPKIHLATFLFTDIESSTQLWERAPKKMKVALQRHHAILQEAITSHDGEVFQIMGDAFCASFPTAPAAASAAVIAQRELHQEPWDLPFPIRVRMGIHTGEAESNASGGYASNPTMNRVARILQAGHGGQILLSLATKELLRDALPVNTNLADMGEHRLKYLIHPEHLFQLRIAGLPSEFPQLNSLSAPRHNLPLQLTSFIGREKEISDVIRLLEKERLITLIGPGGTGKTRLSLQVADELLDQYPDGVWIVELAPVLDPLLIPRTAAIAIGLREEPQRPVMDMLCDYLQDRQLLLILDNCEHLIDACAQLVDTLLHACPHIHLLATSREGLSIAGETAYLVPSLKLPDIQNPPSLESLRHFESVRLFVERASAIVQSFAITEENASAIAQICYRLDGIPLAIELAAGKIRSLSAQQIAQRLDDRFRLLTGGSRTALPRHQTLQATIEWSHQLLPPAEQILFRRLSVFVNGWTLNAAEAVCSDQDSTQEELKREHIQELLIQLVNKSLVMTSERHGEVRYYLLETIRQFTLAKLVEAGESELFHDHHLDFFIQFAENAHPLLRGSREVEWLQRLDDENDNLLFALQWTAKKNSAEPAIRLAGALAAYWTMRSFWQEGAKWLESAIKKAPSELDEMKRREKAARVKMVNGDEISVHPLYDLKRQKAYWHSSLGFVHFGLGSLPESKKHVQEALQLLGYSFPKSGLETMFGIFLQMFRQMLHRVSPARFIGNVSGDKKKEVATEAARLCELMGKLYFHTKETLPIIYTVLRSLNESEKAGPSPELASAYASMAVLMGFMRLHSLTETYVDRSIAVADEVGQPSNLVTVGVITSVYKVTVGKWEEVRARMEMSKRICESLGDYRQWGDCVVLLGESAFIAGNIRYATNVFTELLEDSRRRGQNLTHQCWGLMGVAITDVRLGNPVAAVPLLDEALQILQGLPEPNLASSIEAHGQIGLAYLYLGDEEKALAFADKVLELAENISPTVYSMNVGFAAAAEVYFELWEKSLQNPDRRLDSHRYKLSAKRVLRLLGRFQGFFPIGQPVTSYYQGWYESLMGKSRVAIRSWDKGLKASRKFNMLYEEGLLRLKLGSYLQDEQNERRKHLERAREIFEKMNAVRELKLAEHESKKAEG